MTSKESKIHLGRKSMEGLVPVYTNNTEYQQLSIRPPCRCTKNHHLQRFSESTSTYATYSRVDGNFLRQKPLGREPRSPRTFDIETPAVLDIKNSVIQRLHPHYFSIVRMRGLNTTDELTCEFLNFFSSVYVVNIKDPVPKDPLNRPAYGRQVPRVMTEAATRLYQRYRKLSSKNHDKKFDPEQMQTFLTKDYVETWLYNRNKMNKVKENSKQQKNLLELDSLDNPNVDSSIRLKKPLQRYKIILTHRKKQKYI